MNRKEELIKKLVDSLSEESVNNLIEQFKENPLAYKRKNPGEWYYYFDPLFGPDGFMEGKEHWHKDLFISGNYKQTEEQAKRHAKYMKCLNKLLNLADELNEGWKPDWSDLGQTKYTIYFKYVDNKFAVNSTWSYSDSLTFFKSEEAAYEALDRLDDEDKEVLKGMV